MDANSTNLTATGRIEILQRLNEENFTKLIPTASILTMLAVLGTVGNSLSIYIFTTRMRRNVQNDLFKLLCVVNVLACAVCIPGDIFGLRYQYLYPSKVTCKLLKFLNMFTMAVSVFTLITLAIYRLRAASPGKMVNSTLARLSNPNRNNAMIGMAAIFLISIGTCWIGIVVFGIRTNTTSVPGVTGEDCSVADDIKNTAWPFVFNAILALGFTTLIVITVYAYYKIWRTVKKSRMAIVAHSMVVASPTRTVSKSIHNDLASAAHGTSGGVKTVGAVSNRILDYPEIDTSAPSSVDQVIDIVNSEGRSAYVNNDEKSTPKVAFQNNTASNVETRYTEVKTELKTASRDITENVTSTTTATSQFTFGGTDQESQATNFLSSKTNTTSVLLLNGEDLESSTDPHEHCATSLNSTHPQHLKTPLGTFVGPDGPSNSKLTPSCSNDSTAVSRNTRCNGLPNAIWVSNKITPQNVADLDERNLCMSQSDKQSNIESKCSNRTRDFLTNSSSLVSLFGRENQNDKCNHSSIVGSKVDMDQIFAISDYDMEKGKAEREQMGRCRHVYISSDTEKNMSSDLNLSQNHTKLEHEIHLPYSSSISVLSGRTDTFKKNAEQTIIRQNWPPVLSEDTDNSNVTSTHLSTKSIPQGADDSELQGKLLSMSDSKPSPAEIFCVQTKESDKMDNVLQNPRNSKTDGPNSRLQSRVFNGNKQTTTISLASIASEVYKNETFHKLNSSQATEKQGSSKNVDISSAKTSQSFPAKAKQTTKGKIHKTKTTLEAAVSRTAFLLTFTFIISYLPYFFVSIPRAISPDIDYHVDTARLNLINLSSRLFYISPSINPIIFWASNLDFRRNCKC